MLNLSSTLEKWADGNNRGNTLHKRVGIHTIGLRVWLFAISAFLLLTAPILVAQAEEVDINQTISFREDGPLSTELHLPLCEWFPKGVEPSSGLLLAIHGLTLHGKRYNVVCKAFAADGFYACAPDMRGFGRCYTDKSDQFSVAGESKRKVNYEKSYTEIVQLAMRMRQLHPSLPLFLMGESLGTSMSIKLASDHPELVDGLILSGPTAQVNPLMYFLPQNVYAAAFALLLHPRFNMQTRPFVRYLVSHNPAVADEMIEDPLCRKGLTIAELLKTRAFVAKTLSNARKIEADIPVLIIQGSEDRCMVPGAVTKLCHKLRSSDQTLRWLHAHGHLLLETAYISPGTVNAIANWIEVQDKDHHIQVKQVQKDIIKLGGKLEPVK
jgi:alpha-beta hydrolase superfamily lysophospholipase